MSKWRVEFLNSFLLLLLVAFIGFCVQLCLAENVHAKSDVSIQAPPADLTPTGLRPSVSLDNIVSYSISDADFNEVENSSLLKQISLMPLALSLPAPKQIHIYLSQCVLRI